MLTSWHMLGILQMLVHPRGLLVLSWVQISKRRLRGLSQVTPYLAHRRYWG